jgi:hypothetical protein
MSRPQRRRARPPLSRKPHADSPRLVVQVLGWAVAALLSIRTEVGKEIVTQVVHRALDWTTDATRTFLAAETLPTHGRVAWRSSDPRVAKVSDSGIVTLVGPGRAYVVASLGDVRAFSTIDVLPEGNR